MTLRFNIERIKSNTPNWTCKVHIVHTSLEWQSPEKKLKFQNLILEDEQVLAPILHCYLLFQGILVLYTYISKSCCNSFSGSKSNNESSYPYSIFHSYNIGINEANDRPIISSKEIEYTLKKHSLEFLYSQFIGWNPYICWLLSQLF